MTDSEIIQLLGGVTAVARLLNIKPPSVHAWIEGGIPDGRLRDLAAQIEIKSGGRFSRREHWPDNFAFYWPELATATENIAPAATENVAPTVTIPTETAVGALRGNQVRRSESPSPYTQSDIDRRAKEAQEELDRRSKKIPPLQSPEAGVA